MKIKYFSDDGKEHTSEGACLKYEASNTVEARIVSALSVGGPKALAILGAAMRYDAGVDGARDLGDALEQAARKCAEARIAQGGAKRKRKDKADGAPKVGETKPEERFFDKSSVQNPDLIARGDTRLPTADNPFPAHAGKGFVPAEG